MIYNSQKIYSENARYKKYYEKHTNNGKDKASSYVNCKQCARVCSQHLKITNHTSLKKMLVMNLK